MGKLRHMQGLLAGQGPTGAFLVWKSHWGLKASSLSITELVAAREAAPIGLCAGRRVSGRGWGQGRLGVGDGLGERLAPLGV